MECIGEYKEKSIESDDSQSKPSKMCHVSYVWGCTGLAHAYIHHCSGLEDMLSSPLDYHILSYEPPRGFVIPSFSIYDGSSDLYDHMLHFNQTMILNMRDDRLLCKVFLASLKGPAIAWFHKLPRRSINSFSEFWAVIVS